MRAEIHIGTSGYHYKHWRGPFYPERFSPARMLSFYSERFQTVELNTTFYRLPPKKAVEEWAASTPCCRETKLQVSGQAPLVERILSCSAWNS